MVSKTASFADEARPLVKIQAYVIGPIKSILLARRQDQQAEPVLGGCVGQLGAAMH